MKAVEDRGCLLRYNQKDVIGQLKKIHGKRFVDYRNAWDDASNCSIVSEYPLFVEIGVNSDCNLLCKMCARNFDKSMNGKHINMSLGLIDKIVEQTKSFNLPAISIGQDSECLMHPEIKEIITRIKTIDPVDFFVATNGTLLNKEMSGFLVDCEVDRLQISIDAATKETYKKIRGGNLDILEKNIHDFIEIRESNGKERPFLRLSFCKQKDNVEEQNMFYEKWKDIADIVDFQDFLDLSHVTALAERDYKEYHCPDPFQRIVIDYNGNMFGCCCVGYNRYNFLGNMNDLSILDAWHSKKMEELRDSFRFQKLKKVCLNCRVNRGVL